jgi:hypothetical protein
VQLFIACGTQWRIGMAGPTGLDYVAMAVVARAMGVKLTAARMDGIRVMESEALKVMGKASQASRKS